MIKRIFIVLASVVLLGGLIFLLSRCACITGNHDWVLLEDTATCEVSGEKIYRCTVCGKQYSNESYAKGHEYAGEITTEKFDGYEGQIYKYLGAPCKKCGNVFEYNIMIEAPWKLGDYDIFSCCIENFRLTVTKWGMGVLYNGWKMSDIYEEINAYYGIVEGRGFEFGWRLSNSQSPYFSQGEECTPKVFLGEHFYDAWFSIDKKPEDLSKEETYFISFWARSR